MYKPVLRGTGSHEAPHVCQQSEKGNKWCMLVFRSTLMQWKESTPEKILTRIHLNSSGDTLRNCYN